MDFTRSVSLKLNFETHFFGAQISFAHKVDLFKQNLTIKNRVQYL